MNTRATIRIKGDVRETGYRSIVKRTAQKLKLVGYVEIFKDGSITVICEGDRKAIEDLCRRIRVRDDFVTVKSIRKRLSKPTGEFKVFQVKTCDPAFEAFLGSITMEKGLKHLAKEFENLGKKFEAIAETD